LPPAIAAVVTALIAIAVILARVAAVAIVVIIAIASAVAAIVVTEFAVAEVIGLPRLAVARRVIGAALVAIGAVTIPVRKITAMRRESRSRLALS